MSRIGKLPVLLPEGVKASLVGQDLTITGPKGELKRSFHPEVQISLEGNELLVQIADKENKLQKSLWGLTRALIVGMIQGVTVGHKISLEVQGVGYRFDAQGTKLGLSLGFSHKVEKVCPEGVNVAADPAEKNVIHITGIDKEKVGMFAAQVRILKKPEPYKGKGIRYVGEYVRRKAGKTAGKK